MFDLLSKDGVYESLEEKSAKLCQGLKQNVKALGIDAQFSRVGSMFSMFFTSQEIVDLETVKSCDTEFFKRYFNGLLKEGVYIAPSQFEAGFMSTVHTDEEINLTIEVSRKAMTAARG